MAFSRCGTLPDGHRVSSSIDVEIRFPSRSMSAAHQSSPITFPTLTNHSVSHTHSMRPSPAHSPFLTTHSSCVSPPPSSIPFVSLKRSIPVLFQFLPRIVARRMSIAGFLLGHGDCWCRSSQVACRSTSAGEAEAHWNSYADCLVEVGSV